MKEIATPSSGASDPWQELFDAAGEPPRLDDLPRQRMRADVLERFRDQQRAGRSRAPKAWLAAAAGLIVACTLAALWLRSGEIARVERVVVSQQVLRNGEPLAAGDLLKAGDRLRLLGDGKLAVSVGEISLRLAASDGREAQVELVDAEHWSLETGVLYFDRATQGAPLLISTPLGDVLDIGTQYLIEAEPKVLKVRVREGRVQLRGDGKRYEVEAGAVREVLAGGESSEAPDESSGSAWGWVLEAAPPFDLDGLPVADFLTWIGRETGLEIEYASDSWRESARREILRGDIPTLPADQMLELVLPSTGWPYFRGERRLILGSDTPLDAR